MAHSAMMACTSAGLSFMTFFPHAPSQKPPAADAVSSTAALSIYNKAGCAQEEAVRARRAASKAAGTAASKPAEGQASPFVAIAATMGWETFHLVRVLWLGIIDLPVNSPEKDWSLQVATCLWRVAAGQASDGSVPHIGLAFKLS